MAAGDLERKIIISEETTQLIRLSDSSLRLLLVEDDDLVRERLAALTTAAGFEFTLRAA
jgi:hypothetical protein